MYLVNKIINNEESMLNFGRRLGELLSGGEVLELIGDVGAGKTTLMKGLAKGLAIDEVIQSPSFTIGRQYQCRDDLILAHYDFYRLADAGIMKHELKEVAGDNKSVVAVEWGEDVVDVLPIDRLMITITPISDSVRRIDVVDNGPVSAKLKEGLGCDNLG